MGDYNSDMSLCPIANSCPDGFACNQSPATCSRYMAMTKETPSRYKADRGDSPLPDVDYSGLGAKLRSLIGEDRFKGNYDDGKGESYAEDTRPDDYTGDNKPGYSLDSSSEGFSSPYAKGEDYAGFKGAYDGCEGSGCGSSGYDSSSGESSGGSE